MKLVEALIERAEIKKKNARLQSRMKANLLVQEGDEPSESYDDLVAEYEKNMDRLRELTQRVNETNNRTSFDDSMSVSGAIVLRDCLGAKVRAYRDIYEEATIKLNRYGKNEVRFMRCIDIKELQKTIDSISKDYREIDTKIQSINWTIELI